MNHDQRLTRVRRTPVTASLGPILLQLTLLTTRAPSQTILIDDFNDGLADGWTTFDQTVEEPWGPGTFDASSGAFHLEGDGLVPNSRRDPSVLGARWEPASDPIFADGFVRATVRTEEAGNGVAIALRLEPNSSNYSFFGNTVNNRFRFNKIVDGRCVRCVDMPGGPVFGINEDWNIEAGAVGDQLSMKVWRVGDPEPDAPQWTFRDRSLTTGQIAIGAFVDNRYRRPAPVNATFDDVYFRFPEHDDPFTPPPYDIYLWESPMPVPQQEGPFFVEGSPEKPDMRGDVTTAEDWPDLRITGQVTDLDGQPIPGLKLDFWQVDDQGSYDNSGGYDLRGHLFTEEEGNYELWTVMPASYEPIRNRHVHLKIGGENSGFDSWAYTTQLYFPEPYDNDIDADGTPDKVIEGGALTDLDAIRLDQDSITVGDLQAVGAEFSDLASNILRLNNNPLVDGYFDTTLNIVMPDVFQSPTVMELVPLQAGDADQDLDFDQLDLVQVQVAAVYLTGQPATWGEGDWNGAPGGSPGNPPAGDGLFNQFDIIAAQQGAAYLAGPYAAIQPNGQRGDDQTSVVYDAGSGQLSVDAPTGVELTSINIDSAAGIFTGQAAQNLGGSFDNDADSNIFKATFGSSFGSLSFGNVAQAGLSEEFVLGDLSVVGSLAGGGDLGQVDLVYVPEPSSLFLLCLAGLFALGAGKTKVPSSLWLCSLVMAALTVQAPAQTILVDDFNDGDFDGWTTIDFSLGQPWGPGTFDASSGAFHFQGAQDVVFGQRRDLNARWDQAADPMFTDGYVRATFRVNEEANLAGIILRGSGCSDRDCTTGYGFFGTRVWDNRAGNGRFFVGKYVPGRPGQSFPLPSNLTFGVNEDWIIEAGAVGDQLSMKVWRVGDPEPESPQWTRRDRTLRTGDFGVVTTVDHAYRRPARVDGIIDDVYFTFPEHDDVYAVAPYDIYLWEPTMPVPQQEGPYFVEGSPEKPDMRGDVTADEDWPDLRIAGKVTDLDGQPIPGLKLDFWQVDDQGNYDNSGGYDLRGHLFTDEEGNYELWTVMPASYEPIRNRHVHVKLGGENLGFDSWAYTTQLYFPEPYDNDIDADGTPDKVIEGGVLTDLDAIRLDQDSITMGDLQAVGAEFSDLASNILTLNNDPRIDGYFDTTLNLVMPDVFQSPTAMELVPLHAGDADQDWDFDQLDLVQVQVAAKYLTGQPATWGEGDWDGAPGGSPGNPPAGDGLFNQFDIIAAQQGAAYLAGPYAAIQPNGQRGDDQTSVVYDPHSGELSVDARTGVELTSINIDSAAGIFTGEAAQNLGGSFDTGADENIFKATFGSSFGSVNFGKVAQAGLSEAFVLGDLTVVGSLAGGGDLGEVDLVYVPEPASAWILALGVVSLPLIFAGVSRAGYAKNSGGCRLAALLRTNQCRHPWLHYLQFEAVAHGRIVPGLRKVVKCLLRGGARTRLEFRTLPRYNALVESPFNRS